MLVTVNLIYKLVSERTVKYDPDKVDMIRTPDSIVINYENEELEYSYLPTQT